MNSTNPPTNDIECIIAYLDTGLTLSTYDRVGRERRYRSGDITRERDKKGCVRTAHLTADLTGHVWLTKAGIALLASQARRQWDRAASIAAQKSAIATDIMMGGES